jgi:hypothetical protein
MKLTGVGVSRSRHRRRTAMKVMRNQPKKRFSALREQLKREDAADLARLSPAQRLQAALDLSDFCLMLAAKVREADAQRSLTEGRHGAR